MGAYVWAKLKIGGRVPYDAASEGYEPMLPVHEVHRRLADGLDALRAWLDREHPAMPELERLEIVNDEPGDAD